MVRAVIKLLLLLGAAPSFGQLPPSGEVSWLCKGTANVQQMGNLSLIRENIISSLTVSKNKVNFDVDGYQGVADLLDIADPKSMAEHQAKLSSNKKGYVYFIRAISGVRFTIHTETFYQNGTIDVFLNERTGQFRQTAVPFGKGRMYHFETVCQKM